MQANTTTPIDIVLVIQALVVLFIAAPAMVRAIFRLKMLSLVPIWPRKVGTDE